MDHVVLSSYVFKEPRKCWNRYELNALLCVKLQWVYDRDTNVYDTYKSNFLIHRNIKWYNISNRIRICKLSSQNVFTHVSASVIFIAEEKCWFRMMTHGAQRLSRETFLKCLKHWTRWSKHRQVICCNHQRTTSTLVSSRPPFWIASCHVIKTKSFWSLTVYFRVIIYRHILIF